MKICDPSGVVLDSFDVVGLDSTHLLGFGLRACEGDVLSNGRIPGYFLKPILAMVLSSLDHLHMGTAGNPQEEYLDIHCAGVTESRSA